MFKQAFAVSLAAVLAAPAFAADPGPAYAGFDAGSTKIDSFPGHKPSFGAFVGYVLPWDLSVEAGYRRLGSWDISGCNVKLDQVLVSVIGAWPIGQRFSIFSRLGYNQLRAKASSAGSAGWGSTSGLMYGVGAAWNLDQKSALRLELQKPAKDTTNVSVGLLLRF